MKSCTNSARDGQPTATPERGSNPAPFLALYAKYLIDPKSDVDDLGNDLGLLCDSLVATLKAATDDSQSEGDSRTLANSALLLAEQVSGIAREFAIRSFARKPRVSDAVTNAPASTKPADVVKAMGDALNDAAFAHHAIRATLDAMQEGVFRDLEECIGMYEAAVASTERLDRALSRGLEAWGAR